MDAAIGRAPSNSARRRGITLFGSFVGIVVFYVLAFPKGGIKIYGVPITFGYLLSTVLLLSAMVRGGGLALPLDRITAFLPCALLGLWSIFVMQINGVESSGFAIGYFVSVLYLPLFGLVVCSSLMLDDLGDTVQRALVWAVRVIVVYGIFLFFFKQVTGTWIEIPYLTVNAGDVGELDDKFINRGGIFKLISTYNNGNIFGVSLAIVAPLYLRLERSAVLRALLYVALFLTLSRTAWIGGILVLSLRTLSKGIRPLTFFYLIIGFVTAAAAIFGLLGVLGRDLSFVFDRQLGGRAVQLGVFLDPRLIPDERFTAIPEIAYVGFLQYFGVPGLLLFLAYILTPPVLLALEGVRLIAPTRASACLQGVLIYAVLAAADAAFSYIPVMMIYWMVAGLGFWYAHHQSLRERGRRASAG